MDTPTPRPRHLTAARAAIFGVFGINGFLLAMWVVHIPAIEDRTNIAHSTLGSLLLLLALGAIAGMQLAGPLADRYGSRLLVALSGILLSIAVIGPGLASTAWQLGLALLVFGFGNGALDVSMNSQAVLTEREYGRPIMSAFHGMFSIGGVVGSLVGAVTIGAGWSPAVTLAASSVLGLAAVALCTARLLPPSAHPQPEPHGQRRRGRYSPRVLALGAVAFALMLAEGVANDWSTLQVKEHLDVPASVATLAFGAFSLTMTVGRFTADRVSSALGPVAVVRYGTLIAAAGMATVVVSPWLPTTLLGWALFGLGLSGCVPQIFTAAGNLGAGAAGANMSRVVGMGYIGFLAGPATIGWLTHLVPLTVAMVVPLVCVLVAARFAGIVDRPATRAVAVG
ncbi:MFS transporter [Prescottella equi]|uniref:MFS transporter n=1 Tax=Rhodococcus hoagii TaxID=43767 RepID=A0A9Q5RR74_RHOHA|nr:MFS transporter [Prescottella equi]MBM4487886.1 MFS transporter [Prescottella equi]MBM4499884.1 MFS transporter [Prescottella equi]MBM4505068.1 MFS transporter [Prescottella equi]MBM4552333.1 MFS transporter [Prescottella equi]MBM4567264.1 MFS transporter [Prescottella equi]